MAAGHGLLLRDDSVPSWHFFCLAAPRHFVLAGVVGSLIGDGIAQLSSNRSSRTTGFSWEAARATRLCVYAAVIGTPIGHYWFHFLDKVRLFFVASFSSQETIVCSCIVPLVVGSGWHLPRSFHLVVQIDCNLTRLAGLLVHVLHWLELYGAISVALQFIFPNHMGHPMTAIVKTLLDQVLMAPAGIGVFFVCMGMLEGQSLSQVRLHIWEQPDGDHQLYVMSNQKQLRE